MGWLGLASTLLFLACGGTKSGGLEDQEINNEPLPVVETRWTERTELFLEYAPFVAGEVSRFAVHLTDLKTFKPILTGRVVIHLTGVEDLEFSTESPDRPGIFGVDVTPTQSGSYRLELLLDTPGLTDRHDLGAVTVSTPNQAADLTLKEADEGLITFLKEQQWTLEFATAQAVQQEIAESLVLAAEIEPRTGGQVDIAAPISGRLSENRPARSVGSPVAQGETLVEIAPHSGHGEDRPELELDVVEARGTLELARAERARVNRLVTAGALPNRRKLEARLAEQTAEARVTAATAHLEQLDATRTGNGNGTRDTRFIVRSPINGIIAESNAPPGASVKEGTKLFRLVALDRVNVVGSLPEAALPRLNELVGAELEVPGFSSPVSLHHLVAVGRVLDPESRTVPIIYELHNPDRRIAVGQAVSLRIFSAGATNAVTVPESAVVDDAGKPVIFVQVGGERFDRRTVQLGNREAGQVQITGEIMAGERIVIRGAPLIRLAALSPQVPAHGHTH